MQSFGLDASKVYNHTNGVEAFVKAINDKFSKK